MSEEPNLPQSPPAALALRREPRVEYRDFRDVDGHREYRFRVYGPAGSREIRMCIANAAFSAGRVRRQDGAEVCYQKLLRTVAAVDVPYPDTIPVGEADLLRYRDDHAPAPKRRTQPPKPPAAPEEPERRPPQYAPRAKARPARPPVAEVVPEAVARSFGEGQRVHHATFGAGVTSVSTPDRTVVAFDENGRKTFVTSLLELEVLSPPHTWETGPRGTNRPCNPAD
ncbi:MAG: hypothetical protein U0599_07790 [Vicinamibacteria bacterium]